MKRTLPLRIQQKLERVLRRSVEYALENRDSSSEFIKLHAQEMEKEVVDAHINLYVNEYSVSLGKQGRKAVKILFEKSGREYSTLFVGIV